MVTVRASEVNHKELNSDLAQLPLILDAKDIAKILKVSKPTAYAVMDEIDFPLIRIGRVKRTPREAFFNWLNNRIAK